MPCDELQKFKMFLLGPEEGLQTLFNTESIKEGLPNSVEEAGTPDSATDGGITPEGSISRVACNFM